VWIVWVLVQIRRGRVVLVLSCLQISSRHQGFVWLLYKLQFSVTRFRNIGHDTRKFSGRHFKLENCLKLPASRHSESEDAIVEKGGMKKSSSDGDLNAIELGRLEKSDNALHDRV
jgi:hypothetical protein